MRRIALKIVLVVAAVIVALGLLEWGVRALNLVQVTDYRPIFRPSGGHRMQPLTSMVEVQPEFHVQISINNAGFRDKPFTIERRAGVRRIAAIGDSFTFGTGVPQTARVSEELERLLRERGESVEVYNFGVPDTETTTQFDLVKDEVLRYQPDDLLLMLYIGNDVVDNARLASGEKKEYASQESPAFRLVETLRSHSHLYHLAMNRVAASERLRDLYNQMKTTRRWGEVGNQATLFAVDTERNGTFWQPTFQALGRTVSLAREYHIRPVVILVPARLQYDDQAWTQFLGEGTAPASVRRTAPNDVLAAFAGRTLGVPVLDPLPIFQLAQRGGERLYYPMDGHLTVGGHRRLAEVVAAHFLAERRRPAGEQERTN